jgi:hypothetical protein
MIRGVIRDFGNTRRVITTVVSRSPCLQARSFD